MGELQVVDTPDGAHRAYRSNGGGRPVVVLQEYWGVVPQICDVADRLAAAGFDVAVPDLYDGVATEDREEAASLMMAIDVDTAHRRVERTVAWMRPGEDDVTAGCVGFCMGGGLALSLASASPTIGAAVVFYGFVPWEGVTLRWADPPPLQLHYAGEDRFAPTELGKEIAAATRAAGGDTELWIYPGAQHAFLDDTRPESHDAASTELAWERTVRFLEWTLR
jgi:carboxymethylenebutenolidase